MQFEHFNLLWSNNIYGCTCHIKRKNGAWHIMKLVSVWMYTTINQQVKCSIFSHVQCDITKNSTISLTFEIVQYAFEHCSKIATIMPHISSWKLYLDCFIRVFSASVNVLPAKCTDCSIRVYRFLAIDEIRCNFTVALSKTCRSSLIINSQNLCLLCLH